MKRTNVIFAASMMVLSSLFTACEKSETTDPIIESLQDDDQVSALFDDLQNEVDNLTSSNGPSKSSAVFEAYYSSGTRTDVKSFSGDTVIHTITFVNFINDSSQNGHVKNGVIIAKVLGHPLDAKFERTVILQNFTIDDIKIEGKKQINKIADYQYSVILTGGKVTFPNTTFYTYEFNHTRTWIEGYATPSYIWDDEFTVEGTATGINRLGYSYTHTIINPLLIKRSCRWIVEGTIEIVANEITATIDYGMVDCDNIATITKNGKTTEIKLRGKR
jgi:hypothetical protein